jgi:hypothetical protein
MAQKLQAFADALDGDEEADRDDPEHDSVEDRVSSLEGTAEDLISKIDEATTNFGKLDGLRKVLAEGAAKLASTAPANGHAAAMMTGG